MIETSCFFEILWIYVTSGIDYEYTKKIRKKLIFDQSDYFYNFFFRPKINQKVGKKIFLVTFEEDTSTKTREFKEGDNVSVKIPRIDKAGHNFSKISGTVCKVSTHKEAWYYVLTVYDLLADNYRASDLEPFIS